MSRDFGRPLTPAVRPPTARRRRDADPDAGAPPTDDELRAVERHLVTLTELSGGTAAADAALRAVVVALPRHGPAFNYAALVRWPVAEQRHLAEMVVRRFTERGEWPAIVVAEGLTEPQDLRERLLRSGWVELDGETIMSTRTAAVVPHLDPTLRVEAVTRRSVDEYEALERRIFALADWFAAERARHLTAGIEAGRMRAFLVRLGGEAVAVARLSTEGRTAGVYGVGVAAGHRGKGLGRLVTTVATRAGIATSRGLVWLSVDEANTRARGLYESLGYRPAFRWRRLVAPEPRRSR